MNNPNYNSLSDMLRQSGIIPEDKNIAQDNDNFFENNSDELSYNFNSNYVEIPENFKKEEIKPHKKRLNQYDLELIQNNRTSSKQNDNELVKRFISFKKNRLNSGKSSLIEFLFYKFFPKIYAAKLIKQAMEKFRELDIDAKNLLDKTIPYGENELRYNDLVKYISCASEIQTKLRGKI